MYLQIDFLLSAARELLHVRCELDAVLHRLHLQVTGVRPKCTHARRRSMTRNTHCISGIQLSVAGSMSTRWGFRGCETCLKRY